MDQFIRSQNVERYSRLLERVAEELDRRLIVNLLAQEQQKQKDAGDPVCRLKMSEGGNEQATLQTPSRRSRRRREMAKEYPADERNLNAASAFDRLAATVDAIPQDVFEAYSELGGVHDGLLDVERWTEMLRDVGFNSAPETAEDFIRSFIADRTVRGG